MNDGDQRKANKKTLEQIFSLISSKRADETGAFVTEDLYFELPYGPDRKPVEARSRDAFLAMNAQTWPAFKHFALTITRIHDLVDPSMLIAEYTSEGAIVSTGKAYENRYIGVFGFRDGLVCEWHEYHNPDVPAYAFSAEA
jgi:ketosteroid isomerase-like protein